MPTPIKLVKTYLVDELSDSEIKLSLSVSLPLG